MTVGDVVTVVLAFVRANGPIGAVALLMAAITLLLAAFYSYRKVTTQLPGRQTFDVGGSFDHYYSRILPAATIGVVNLIYAAYGGWALSYFPARRDFRWLYEPGGNLFLGIIATGFVAFLAGRGVTELAKALWFALHWIPLEARGVKWRIADSGEPYRVLWLRPNGESLYDSTIRDHRLHQEIDAIRKRRHALLKETALAGLSIVAWLGAPDLIKTFYPLLPFEVVAFFGKWNVPTIAAWLFLLFAAIPKSVAAIAALIDELLYRAGAQFISGAKVIDTKPTPLGRGDVDNQKAHGDADFVPAAEAVSRMGGRA
jgi:hypothetical protein